MFLIQNMVRLVLAQMTDTLERPYSGSQTLKLPASWARTGILALLTLAAGVVALAIGLNFRSLPADAPLVADSTVGELAAWMAQQATGEETPPALLAALVKPRLPTADDEDANTEALVTWMQSVVAVWCIVVAVAAAVGIVGLVRRAGWARAVLIVALLGVDMLLFLIPPLEGESAFGLALAAVLLLLVALMFAPGRATRVIGFFVAISTILVLWEGVKAGAESIGYAITVPQSAWQQTAYPTLEDALDALQNGETAAVFADRKDLETLMPAGGAAADGQAYPALRYISLDTREQVFIFPVNPALPGRLNIAVRQEDASLYRQPSQLADQPVGAAEGSFAADRYLALPRSVTLLDLQIFNDLNLPHLQSIAEAFLQPARRNGDLLLVRILGEAGLYTWQEAGLGFLIGVVLGLFLGVVFAHSRLMERALLPYVVASQTVPILAIAPMVVIWMGSGPTAVAVIAAYITFFPVTINTLRGLLSPSPTAVELMNSYAASRWTILWKLRFPAAMPYIFAALKVSATASVVGAIIGELPSSIGDGLGRAILDFSSDYSLISTPKLWAAIVTAASVGVIFFILVSIIERVMLRRYVRSV